MPTLSGRWPFQVPDDDFPLKPMRNLFSFVLQGVRDALNSQKVSSAASSTSDRDAKFPDPSQGDRCFRTDLGYEETYYGPYNATSNPGGAAPAGWYPTPGAPLYARVEKTNDFQTIPTGNGVLVSGLSLRSYFGEFTFANGRLRVPRDGVYMATSRLYGSGNNLSALVGGLNKSGSSIDLEAGATVRMKRTAGDVDETAESSSFFKYTAGDQLAMAAYALGGPASIYGSVNAPHSSTGFLLRYVGPLR